MGRGLLILTYHFPPSAASGAFRMLGFARHLPKYGWGVGVVTPATMPWEPVDTGLAAQVPPATEVRQVPYPRGLWSKPLRWLAPYAVWLTGGRRGAAEFMRQARPDAVLTSGPPHCVHLLGRWLKRHFGLPWVADFRDPWMAGGKPASRFSARQWLQRRLERSVMAAADVIVANAPRAADLFRAAYPACAAKVVTITNGYDPEPFALLRGRTADGKFRLVHTGEVYAGRDPRPLLDALAGLAKEGGTNFPAEARFVGQTHDLARAVQERGLEDVVTLPGQAPYGQTLREMVEADALLLLDSPGRRVGVPAKLYEYLGAGRPVLALAEPDGDVARVLEQSGVPHRLAAPTDTAAIRQALLGLVRVYHEGRLEAAAGGTASGFTREKLAGKLAAVLDGTVKTCPTVHGHGVLVRG